MPMKLLVVTHDYPPILSARSIRWRALAEHWVLQGHEIHVVSAWQDGFLEEEVLQGVHVHRVNALWLEKLRALFKRASRPVDDQRSGDFNAPSLSSLAKLKAAIARITYWGYHKIYKQLYWPDAAHPWRQPAVKTSRNLIATQAFDAVITVSPYFTAHRVGLDIRRQFPRLKWLVDIGDPFSFLDSDPPNNRRLYRALNQHEEQRVFQQADRISVTTPETRALYTELFPQCASKIHVIPPLLTFPDAAVDPAPFFPKDDVLRWVYLGRLYTDIRRPDFLLKLFVETQRRLPDKPMELHFVGDTHDVHEAFEPYQEYMQTAIFVHSPVDRRTVQRILRDADLLVNLGNKTGYQLPSKVVEYANACKPILNIAQIEKDSSATFFVRHPGALTLHIVTEKDFSRHVNATVHFFSQLPKSYDETALHAWLSAHKPSAVSTVYLDLILAATQMESENQPPAVS